MVRLGVSFMIFLNNKYEWPGHASPIDGLSGAGLIPGTAEDAEQKTDPVSGVEPPTVVVRSPARARGRIELKNVSFRYPSRPDVEVRLTEEYLD